MKQYFCSRNQIAQTLLISGLLDDAGNPTIIILKRPKTIKINVFFFRDCSRGLECANTENILFAWANGATAKTLPKGTINYVMHLSMVCLWVEGGQSLGICRQMAPSGKGF